MYNGEKDNQKDIRKMKNLLFLAFVFGYVSAASAENLFLQENLWKACHYYDAKGELIKEGCEPSAIKFANCENNVCFFQAAFDWTPSRWEAACHIWGKMTILSDTHAQGKGTAEYRTTNLEDHMFEDCELSFDITGETMKIAITSGCSKGCNSKRDPFEFNNTYRIDNVGFVY